MRIRTLLNKCEKLKSFVYENDYIQGADLIIEVRARKNSKPVCSSCKKRGSTYDHSPVSRKYEFVPLWGMRVFLSYRMRRVNCKKCGVKTEEVPWAKGKNTVTKTYSQFLAHWAKKMSWNEVAKTFKTTWHSVYISVKQIVEYGLENRQLDNIISIGVDEIKFGEGHKYLTLIYQLDKGIKRLLCIEKERTVNSLLSALEALGEENLKKIKFVCSDMWRPYLKVIKDMLPNALNILDRFHVKKKLNDAVDDVRKAEVKQMKKDGFEPVLEKTKYCFLKNEENLTQKQKLKLDDVLRLDLKSVKAYLLKNSFEIFWRYNSPRWAKWYIRKWCERVNKSNLKPMKGFVKTLKRHEDLLMNWFRAEKKYSSGIVEGLNRRVNLVTRKSYGFKNYEILKLALFHTMGHLPEPEQTHRYY